MGRLHGFIVRLATIAMLSLATTGYAATSTNRFTLDFPAKDSTLTWTQSVNSLADKTATKEIFLPANFDLWLKQLNRQADYRECGERKRVNSLTPRYEDGYLEIPLQVEYERSSCKRYVVFCPNLSLDQRCDKTVRKVREKASGTAYVKFQPQVGNPCQWAINSIIRHTAGNLQDSEGALAVLSQSVLNIENMLAAMIKAPPELFGPVRFSDGSTWRVGNGSTCTRQR